MDCQTFLRRIGWDSRTLTYPEVSKALRGLNSGKSPGLDGLPADFYYGCWDVIGPDFYDVFLECMKRVTLPWRCRRAVLTLLPKRRILGA